MSSEQRKSPFWVTALILALICLLAWALRMIPFRQVFAPEGIFFYGADSYYHLRRIMLAVQDYPNVPVFDSYMAYPEGAWCFWPPLFDFAIACVSLIIGLGHPSQRLVETVAALTPPLLGALTVIPVYALARIIFGRSEHQQMGNGRAPSFLAALAFALMPAHIAYSTVGRTDHHVAETLLFVTVSALLLQALEPTAAVREGRLARLYRPWAIAAGLALAGLFLVQTASTVYAAILLAFIAAQAVSLELRRQDPTQVLGEGAITFAVASIVLLVFCNLSPWLGSQAMLRLSWFHLAVVSGPAVVLAVWAMTWRPQTPLRHLLVGVLPGALGIALAAGVFMPGVSDAIRSGLEFIVRPDPWAATLAESRPLFRGAGGLLSTSFAEVELSWGLFLVPVALALFVYRERFEQRPASLYFFIVTLALGALTLMQQRFASVFSIYVCLSIGYAVALIPEIVGAQRTGSSHAAPTPFGMTLQAIAFAVLLYPCISYFAPLCGPLHEAADRFSTVPKDLYKALTWMAKETPATSHFDSPTTMPEYGVLCEWDQGHWVQYIARRPVLGNNFGSQLHRDEFVDSIRFYLAQGEAQVMPIILRYNVRYVITTPLVEKVEDYARIADQTGKQYVEIAVSPDGQRTTTILPSYYPLAGVQLHEYDGQAFEMPKVKGQRLAQFRLVYEGDPGPPKPGEKQETPVKIFEVVRGAKVKGQAAPSASVTVQTTIKTNTGRTFPYVASAKTNPRGEFDIVLPYSTTGGASVRTEKDYTLTCGTFKTTVSVPERAVQKGGVITVSGANAPQRVK